VLLSEMVDKVPNIITAYGRTAPERRLTGTWSRVPASFTYSKSTRVTSGVWPEILEKLSKIAASLCPKRKDGTSVIASDFDLAHLNLYRDGQDKLSWHADKDGTTECIVSFTFYDPSGLQNDEKEFIRDFCIRDNQSKEVTYIGLGQGSVIVMLPDMQKYAEHCVPERKKVKCGRINLTLRQHHL